MIITETPVILNLGRICKDAGLQWKAYLDHLQDIFPNGKALLVNDGSQNFIATRDGSYWGDVPNQPFAYRVDQ